MDISQVFLAASTVHGILGTGHSEAVYEEALSIELRLRGINNAQQVPVVIQYKGYNIGVGYIDILTEEKTILEIKSIAKLSNKDEQQVRKYLIATGLDHGFLINYGKDLEITEVRNEVTDDQIISEAG